MAQIRKYQPGGKTPNKIGVLTIDGKEYTGDGFIQHMRDYRKTLDDKVADQFGNIINALEAGENLQYDSDSDVLTGNVDWNVSKLQDKRLDKGEDRTKIGKIFGGLNEGKEQRVRYAINALRGMGTYEEPKEEVKGKSIDWSKDINLVYSKGKDGKRTFSKLDNANAVDRLNQFATLIGSDWTDNDTFTGYNGLTRDQYMKAYTDLTDAISAIENGTWDENTLKVLKDFGIFDNGGASTSSKTGKGGASAGNGGSDTTNRYFTTDSNGNLNATTALNALYPGNAIFNDFWEKSSGYRDEYKGLKGYIKFDGKLYKISDLSNPNSTIYKYLQNNGFFDLTNADQYAEANKKINFLWDNPLEYELYDPTQFYHPALTTWSKDDQYRYRPLTGAFEYTIDGYDNPEIVQYWNKNTERDIYGLPKTYKYAILTDDGLIDVNESDLKRINGGEQKGLSMYPIIQDEGAYQGYYEVSDNDKFNNPIYTAYIHATDTNQPVIFNYRDFDRKTGSPLYNKNIKIDRNIWNLLNSKQFFENLMSDVKKGNYQTHFTNAFEDAVGSGVRDLFNRELEIADWKELGFTNEDAQTLYNYFNNLGSGGSRFDRQQKYLVDRYIPKKQSGGLIGTSKAPEVNTKKNQIDVVAKDLSKPEDIELSKEFWKKLSDADKMELGSLVADIGALVSGLYTGGGNPLAAGLGVAGTLTSFGAGVTRDGLDWGDAGNLVLGLGLDVASLFPGLGLGSTATKVVKSVKKVGGVLNTLLMGVGAVDAVKGIKNIADGKGSINDYRSLMNGLLVLNKVVPDLKLLKNTTFKGKTTTKGNVKNAPALKKEFVDGIIAKGKQNGVDLTHYNGARNSWIDDQGKIDYDEAYKALKDSKYINEWGLTSWFRDLRGKINEGVASIADNTIHGSWNPFSKNYRFDIDNRVLKPEVLTNPTKYKKVIANYGLDNVPQESWPTRNFKAVDGKYYILPTQKLWGTDIMHRDVTAQTIDLNEMRNARYFGSYKHGGVIKGQNGLFNSNYNPYTGRHANPTKANDLAPDVTFSPLNITLQQKATIGKPFTPPPMFSSNYQAYKGPVRPQLLGKATTFEDLKTPIPGIGSRLFYTGVADALIDSKGAGEDPPEWKQKLKDYASRAFNYENLNTLGQVIGAVAANHKVAKVTENALKSMPLSRNVFQASTPAYYENTRGFDVRRDVLLNTQLPQTADAKLNAQWKRNIASELDKVYRGKYDYLSQNRNQYNQFVNQIENKNRELRVAESNAFMDRAAQRNMALAENTAGMIANDFKTFEQALKKGLYNYQQDRAVYDQLALSDRKKMLFDKYLKAATDWAKANKAGVGEEYMSDIDRYFKYNQAAKDLYENDIMQLNKSIYRPHSLFSPRFAKKGGKLSAQDHIKINKHKSQDRILENKYNAIDKAVQKLNDNVIKIFLNMMK